MLELDLAKEKSHLKMIALKSLEISQTSNREATNYLIQNIGLKPTRTKNEAYYAEASAYLRGVVFANANMPSEAGDAIALSHVLPHRGGNFLFDEVVKQSLAIAALQDNAIARGVPAITIASMPRAASAAFTETLAALTNAPTMRISIGKFPNHNVVPSWAQRFIRGGAILHDHFGATTFNLAALRDCGIDRVHMIVRDPRSAAASAVIHSSDHFTEDAFAAILKNQYLPWLEQWLQAEAGGLLRIEWIRKMDFTKSSAALSSALRQIIESSGGRSDLLLGAQNVVISEANHLVGNDDAWRAKVSPQLQRQIWFQIPQAVRELLELKP